MSACRGLEVTQPVKQETPIVRLEVPAKLLAISGESRHLIRSCFQQNDLNMLGLLPNELEPTQQRIYSVFEPASGGDSLSAFGSPIFQSVVIFR